VQPTPFTIIVNTSDAYADCWDPFFTLFKRYWPGCTAPILLNTEKRSYGVSGLDVQATRVEEHAGRRLTWSECLLACLSRVDSPIVMYLQEDYFLEEPVDERRLAAIVAWMSANANVATVGLTTFGARGPYGPSPLPTLWEVDRRARYRASLQAGLWRMESLRTLLRAEENGWMFEIYGTRRSRTFPGAFLTVNHNDEHRRRVFPYSHAGIVKGQWHRTVPALFAANGISVPFERRGFYSPRPRLLEKFRTLRKLLESPRLLVRGLRGH
jgi:hypothetical protein